MRYTSPTELRSGRHYIRDHTNSSKLIHRHLESTAQSEGVMDYAALILFVTLAGSRHFSAAAMLISSTRTTCTAPRLAPSMI